MAPGFSALMVAMQAGAGMTAELGTMFCRPKPMHLKPWVYLATVSWVVLVFSQQLLLLRFMSTRRFGWQLVPLSMQ